MTLYEPTDRAAADPAERSSRRREPDREVELELIALLETHARREGRALAAYQRLSEDSPDPGVQYLAGLVLEDERRHHQVAREMLHQLQAFVWEVDVEPSVPWLRRRANPELRAEVLRLLAFERDDARELRRLRKQLRRTSASSLLPLLADLMLKDTAKHIAILELVRDHTARS